MNAVSAAEMAAIRSEIASAALDLPCVIKRKTQSRDAYGTATETWATVATVNAGVSSPSMTHLQNFAYLIGSSITYQVNLPYGQDIQVDDHLEMGSDILVVQVEISQQSYSAVSTVLASKVEHSG
jgi:head-tail adaptor